MTGGLLLVVTVSVPVALAGAETETETGNVIVVETVTVTATVPGKGIVSGIATTVIRTAKTSPSGGATLPTGAGVLLLVARTGPGLRPLQMT